MVKSMDTEKRRELELTMQFIIHICLCIQISPHLPPQTSILCLNMIESSLFFINNKCASFLSDNVNNSHNLLEVLPSIRQHAKGFPFMT